MSRPPPVSNLLNDSPDGPPVEFLTTTQAAERMGVKPSTVRKSILMGRLPAVRHRGAWRLQPKDVDAYRVGVLMRREAAGKK